MTDNDVRSSTRHDNSTTAKLCIKLARISVGSDNMASGDFFPVQVVEVSVTQVRQLQVQSVYELGLKVHVQPTHRAV